MSRLFQVVDAIDVGDAKFLNPRMETDVAIVLGPTGVIDDPIQHPGRYANYALLAPGAEVGETVRLTLYARPLAGSPLNRGLRVIGVPPLLHDDQRGILAQAPAGWQGTQNVYVWPSFIGSQTHFFMTERGVPAYTQLEWTGTTWSPGFVSDGVSFF